MFCRKCFQPLSEGARFCKYCGHPVEGQTKPGQTQQGYAQQQQGSSVRPQQGYAQPQQGPVQSQQGYTQSQQDYPQQWSNQPQQGYAQYQQGYPPSQQGYPQQGYAQPQQGYPSQQEYAQPQQGYPYQQGYAQPQSGYPQQWTDPQQQGYPQQWADPQQQMYPFPEAMAPNQVPSLMGKIKEGVMDIIHHPAKLLPAIILSVVWLVISLLMALGHDLPPVRWLNTLTYASGGMYGGPLGAAGGIFGKAVFAAVVNTIVLALWSGKNPFAKDPNGQSLMRKAASSGMATVAPFIIGLGASLVLYYFFNVTGSTGNVMVGVIAAIGAIQAMQSSHGIIFSIVFTIAGKASGGMAPSSTAVRNSLMGAAGGFALSVPLTYLCQSLVIGVGGTAVLLLGVLLSVLGQQKPAKA